MLQYISNYIQRGICTNQNKIGKKQKTLETFEKKLKNATGNHISLSWKYISNQSIFFSEIWKFSNLCHFFSKLCTSLPYYINVSIKFPISRRFDGFDKTLGVIPKLCWQNLSLLWPRLTLFAVLLNKTYQVMMTFHETPSPLLST